MTRSDRDGCLAKAAHVDSLRPILPGGGRHFWNQKSVAYQHPPAFDFTNVAHAVAYRFDILDDRHDLVSFTAARPTESLACVWTNVAARGFVTVFCHGVDPKACGTCVVPTEFGGRLVVAQDLSGLPPYLNWPGCRRHAILDALDAAVPGGMPARLLTDGYARAMAVRKDASGRTAGVLLMNLGLGETPPLELAIRRGVGDAWQVMLPKGGSSPAETVRRSAGETVVRLPPLQAWQPVLVMPALPPLQLEGARI